MYIFFRICPYLSCRYKNVHCNVVQVVKIHLLDLT